MHGAKIALLALVVMAACSRAPNSVDKDAINQGPDEFSILPARPLEMPESYSSLPVPTPGGTNITDPNPGASDAALVAAVSRYGVPADIRAVVASEDAPLLKRATDGGFIGFITRSSYFKVYAQQALDAFAELLRFRAAGVQTPSAPPAN
jgi:hypothetical protein